MAVTESRSPDDLGFDPDGLRDKYRAERSKRLRADGNDQYTEVAGEFSRFVDDPYIEAEVERAPLTDEVDVVVIGGGFGGLLMGARLHEAGIDDVRLIEKAGDFGGTWYWNRYPGAMCDVESYVYMPLLEELDYIPSQKYSHAPEILAHSAAIARHYGLYDNACLQTEVTELRWVESDQRWLVATNRGDAMSARYVVMANGPLHRPKLPGIDGIETFKGHSFHTSRWDYDYTGGDPDGNLTGLANKRVAVIGTGATAVQCVPHLGAAAEHLYVFQRTPSSIDIRANRETDPEWAESLGEGWQRERMENFNSLVSGIPQAEDLVNDGWTDIIGKMLAMLRSDGDMSPGGIAETMELADFEKMEEIRSRVDEIIDDSGVAESLKPYYRQFCKRPCFHDDYLKTFNRPNVELVDTDGRGVERITQRGVVVDGVEYEVDCIVFATGFEVGTGYSRRAGYEIVGRDDLTLSDKWADGVRTLHGIASQGFPNCFIMSQTQGALAVNYPHMLNELAMHLSYILGEALPSGATVEVTAEAEQEWVETIISSARQRGDFFENCTPGYYNNEGQPTGRAVQNGPHGGGPVAFWKILSNWRDEGSFEGLTMTRAGTPAG
ncbi:MAG: NAD(P)/FAD-dependent oxidoreductase [Acidobacteria bacterium]|nr:NAD(P)/FAD-dependent oxidoreductase [Acidobacteriota bacterium]